MINITLKINSWYVLPNEILQIDNVNNISAWHNLELKPSFELIPAMQRRRMSYLSKLAVQTALAITKDTHIDYAIFSSRHGELFRTVTLIQDILKGEEASPMVFSQSVHNTASGLFTITAKRPVPVTSISASQDSLHNGLIEAYSYLENNPEHKVLLVDFDEQLPSIYAQYQTLFHPGYSLGLILSKGADFQIIREQNITGEITQNPQALSLIKGLNKDSTTIEKNWQIYSKKYCWKWNKIA